MILKGDPEWELGVALEAFAAAEVNGVYDDNENRGFNGMGAQLGGDTCTIIFNCRTK